MTPAKLRPGDEIRFVSPAVKYAVHSRRRTGGCLKPPGEFARYRSQGGVTSRRSFSRVSEPRCLAKAEETYIRTEIGSEEIGHSFFSRVLMSQLLDGLHPPGETGATS